MITKRNLLNLIKNIITNGEYIRDPIKLPIYKMKLRYTGRISKNS